MVLDCPEPRLLAAFYRDPLGLDTLYTSPGWITLGSRENGWAMSLQQGPDFRAPTWPDNEVPTQAHIDVLVPDLDVAEPAILPGVRGCYADGANPRIPGVRRPERPSVLSCNCRERPRMG
jgi:hypothetical protein